MESHINVTVIIPHYNTIDTLSRAINSVPNSDTIEVIVVDNSPKPISKEDVIGVKRPFELIFTPNSRGAGGARNEAILNAKGKFLVFLDADDFYSDCVESIFDDLIIKYTNTDVILFRSGAVNSDTLQPSNRMSGYMLQFDKYFNAPTELEKDILKFSYTSICGKIYRRDYIVENKILCDEVAASNDVMFTTKAAALTKNIKVDNRVLYIATEREGSLMKTPSTKNLKARMIVRVRHNRFMRKQGLKDFSYGYVSLLKQMYNVSLNLGLWGTWYVISNAENIFTHSKY